MAGCAAGERIEDGDTIDTDHYRLAVHGERLGAQLAGRHGGGRRQSRCPIDFIPKPLLREAVEQAVAAGRNQIGLSAAAGHVGRVPGLQICRGLGRADDVAEQARTEIGAETLDVVADRGYYAPRRSIKSSPASSRTQSGRQSRTFSHSLDPDRTLAAVN
jgi:hypothetical protein